MRGPFSRAAGGGLAVVLIVAGCTQTNNGKASQSRITTAKSSAAGSPSGARATGANSAMCRDFRNAGGRITDIQHGDKYGAKLWKQLAADAPAEIKPDAELVARFVAQVAAGHPDVRAVPKAVTALGKITDWATKNCI